MNRNTMAWLVGFVLVAGAFGSAAWVYPTLPAKIPIHWNLEGNVDGYGGPRSIFLMPAVMLFLLAMFAVLPILSPKPFDVSEFRSTYLVVMDITIAMMGYLHGVILYGSLHPDMAVGRALVCGLMFGIAAMGNFMGKVRRNLYVGIKTPWTLASDRVWADTHRLGAWFMVGGGTIGGILCLLGLPVWLAIIPLAISVVVPVVFSFTHYRALQRRGELEN